MRMRLQMRFAMSWAPRLCEVLSSEIACKDRVIYDLQWFDGLDRNFEATVCRVCAVAAGWVGGCGRGNCRLDERLRY